MTGLGLNQSKWAPSSQRLTSADYRHLKGSISNPHLAAPTARKSSGEKRQLAQLQAYQRAWKSLRRLKWKSTTLLFCHHRALSQQTDNVINGINFPITSDTGKANAAEIMFKVDFFEYYALLEIVVVALLACFGMVISADRTTGAVPVPLIEKDLNRSIHSDAYIDENSIIGDSHAFHGYAHRFHANVLAALDRPSNPLHPILGTGRVRQYLGIAKEFRNRWKEVELEPAENSDQFAGLHNSYQKILVDLKLDEMLASLLAALEESRSLASQYLASVYGSIEVDMTGADDENAWDESVVMEDTMDWD